MRKISTIKTIKEEDEDSEMMDADVESLAIDSIDQQTSFIDTESELAGEERKGEKLEIQDARRYKTEVPTIEDFDRRAKSNYLTSEEGDLARYKTEKEQQSYLKGRKSALTISKSKNWFD